jgi:hypothetical protein
MNSHPLLTLLIPTVVAIASWFVGSWLSLRRDRANKLRELRVQYLIDAYRRLEAVVHRQMDSQQSSLMESAIADVQLFGSAPQVAAARRFVSEMQGGSGSLNDLLLILRNDLRNELELEPLDEGFFHLRIGPGSNEGRN